MQLTTNSSLAAPSGCGNDVAALPAATGSSHAERPEKRRMAVSTLLLLLLVTVLLAAGCSVRDAKASALRFAANTLSQSVFCLQSSVPLTQSTFKPSAVAVTSAAPAPVPRQLEAAASEHRDLRIEGPSDLRTITCPIERERLLHLGLPRTL
jgi:hypothetical protein